MSKISLCVIHYFPPNPVQGKQCSSIWGSQELLWAAASRHITQHLDIFVLENMLLVQLTSLYTI